YQGWFEDAGRKKLQRSGCLESGNRRRDRIENARCLARGLGGMGSLRIHTAQARALRKDRHRYAVTPDSGPVDPRQSAAHAIIIDEVAGFEIIGPVEHQGGVTQQVIDVRRSQVGYYARNLHAGIDSPQSPLGSDGFGARFGSVGLVEEPLALEIAQFDVIAVDDGEASGACARKRSRLKAAESAAADDSDVRSEQTPLPFFADSGEQNLARIAVPLGRCHPSRW